MYYPTYLGPVDYLVIGHVTRDLTPDRERLGGTAAYAALTAKALGLRVGIVTSWAKEISPHPLEDIPTINYPCEASTTFENIPTHEGRIQIIHHVANTLDLFLIPDSWRTPAIVHFGPVAQEVEPSLLRHFSSSFIGVTPQGWLRSWGKDGRVQFTDWPESIYVLSQCGAAVISLEDVEENEELIEDMASSSRVLAVTENSEGARIYWHGDIRRFRAPSVDEIDATGAGDVFAAAFFIRLYQTRDPWEAGRFATQLASYSVTRPGLEGIPTPAEIEETMVEVF